MGGLLGSDKGARARLSKGRVTVTDGTACFASQWQLVIVFLVLVGVLLFRPTGLLGERVGA